MPELGTPEHDALAREFTFMYVLIEYAARRFYASERDAGEWIDHGGEA